MTDDLYTVYALTESDTGRVRYIGRTTQPLLIRKSEHRSRAKAGEPGEKGDWIRALWARGADVFIYPLHTAAPADMERQAIQRHLAAGCDLVNVLLTQLPESPQAAQERADKARQQAIKTRRERYPDWAEKCAQAQRLAWADPDKRAARLERMDASDRGRKISEQRKKDAACGAGCFSPQAAQKRREAMRQRWQDPEKRAAWIEAIQKGRRAAVAQAQRGLIPQN